MSSAPPGRNFYFNNFTNSQEQTLIEDLVIESIKIYGMEVYYLPRTITDRDSLYGEDADSSYNNAYLIEMYIKNIHGFGGQGDLFSKFGLEIRDQVTFTVAIREFSRSVGDYSDEVRPFEGDIIYFPLNRKFFRINFVEHESIFYQMGSLQVYELQCELFEYAGETISTGIPEIDDLISSNYDMNRQGTGLTLEDTVGSILDENSCLPILFEDYDMPIDDELDSQNEYFQTQGNNIIDWTEFDPFSTGSTSTNEYY